MASGVGTPAFNQVISETTLERIGIGGCREWAQITGVLERQDRIVPYLISKGVEHAGAEVQAVINRLDEVCAAASPPTGPELAPTCEAWQALSVTEKNARIRAFFAARVAPGWINDTDISFTRTRIDVECVRSDVDASDSATAIENTRVEVTLTSPAVPLSPTGSSITLDGVPMTLLSARPPSLTFERHGLTVGEHTLAVSGPGLVSIRQDVMTTIGATTAVSVSLQAQRASLRVVVAAPSGGSAAEAVVTLDGVALTRGPDGSYTQASVGIGLLGGVPGIVPGTHDLCVTAAGFVQQCKSVAFGPGQAVAEGFALVAAPASVTVAVTGPEDAEVLLDGRAVPRVSATSYAATGVAPGAHVLAVSAPGFVSAQQNVTVAGGQSATATFTMVAVPVPTENVITTGFRVVVWPLSDMEYTGAYIAPIGLVTTMPRADGTIEWALPPGTYTIQLRKRGFITQTAPATIVAGQVLDLGRVTLLADPAGTTLAVPAPKKTNWFGWLVAASVVGLGGKYVMDQQKEGAKSGAGGKPGAGGKRDNPDASTIVPVALGLAAAGGAVYLATRPAQAMTAPASSAPAIAASRPRYAQPTDQAAAPVENVDARIAHGEQFTRAAPPAPSTVVSRLANNTGARQLFAFQALLYSYGFTQYLPDGVIGDHTRAMITDINTLAGDANPSSVFNTGMYAKAATALAPLHRLTKIIPSLPQATITAVNREIVSMAPGKPLLQVHATAIAA